MSNILKTIFIGIIATVFGCSKSGSEIVVTERGYYPLTNGSQWVYDQDDAGKLSAVHTQISGKVEIDGRTYVLEIYSNGNYTDTTFIRRGHDTVFAYGQATLNDEILLIERTGAQWSRSFDDGNYDITITYTVVGIEDVRDVKEKSFSDVLHLHTEVYFATSEPTKATSESYFAKNIGRIELIDNSGAYSKRIVNYTIR